MSRMSFNQAKQISIVDYLSRLGFESAKVRGTDQWYHAPYRYERTPSFKVNTKLNLWYDHGTGEGGTILDLGAKLHQCSLSDFLDRLSERSQGIYSPLFHQQVNPVVQPENRLEILSVKELTNADLLHYINTRGIASAIAKEFCKEVQFRIGSPSYEAIGFPSRSGGYELRNRWFKGSSSPKDVSIVNILEGKADKISVLEGFMDFLSLQNLKKDDKEIKKITENSDFLILNSLRLINRSLPLLQSYSTINLFLDNDSAAKEVKEKLVERAVIFFDASVFYSNHKDVNEYLIAQAKIKQGQQQEQPVNRRLHRHRR